MEILLAVLAGMGIGFYLGQLWIMYRQTKGHMLPSLPFNPYTGDALPKSPSTPTIFSRPEQKVADPVKGKVVNPREITDHKPGQNGTWV